MKGISGPLERNALRVCAKSPTTVLRDFLPQAASLARATRQVT